MNKKFLVIAGPCAIESEEQLYKTAKPIAKNIDFLRAGAYKPRTSPYSFQGLGKEGLLILKKVSKKLKIKTVTEVLDTRDVDLVSTYTDIIQIGARNMQNYSLLKEAGKTGKPVLLKRGFSATVEEWLSALEYILKEGNKKVILCERGIRTFENSTRFTLDLGGALVAKKKSGLPVIIDPSHGTGRPDLVSPFVKAAKASGLDGIMAEVHYNPKVAKSDADQAITPRKFNKIINEL